MMESFVRSSEPIEAADCPLERSLLSVVPAELALFELVVLCAREIGVESLVDLFEEELSVLCRGLSSPEPAIAP